MGEQSIFEETHFISFSFFPHFWHCRYVVFGTYWFRMQLYCMFTGKGKTCEAQFINTTHFCISSSLHMSLSTLGKEICEFLSSGKSLGTSKEDSEGLAMSETSESHLLMAEGTYVCCFQHSLTLTKPHTGWVQTPQTHQNSSASTHSSFSSVDQQLKQGDLSEKIQWPRNALVVDFFF